jgi:hypothetical protein
MTTRPSGSVTAERQRNGAWPPSYRAGSSVGTGHGTYRGGPNGVSAWAFGTETSVMTRTASTARIRAVRIPISSIRTAASPDRTVAPSTPSRDIVVCSTPW